MTAKASELAPIPNAWRLHDAKARFSEVVRRAREEGPQRVTLHGRDAVVIIDAAAYDRERSTRTGKGLVDILSASPPGDLDTDRPILASQIRDIDL